MEKREIILSDTDYDFLFKKLEYVFKRSGNFLVEKVKNKQPLNKDDVLLLLKKLEYKFKKSNHEIIARLIEYSGEEVSLIQYSNLKAKSKRELKMKI